MISEGSRDTEDLSNGYGIFNFAIKKLNIYIFKDNKIKNRHFKLQYYITVLLF